VNRLLLFLMFTVGTLGSADVFAKGGGGHSHSGDSHVRGHVRKDGVYVQPHSRTAPNKTQRDNYSSKPNVNPYTGKDGTRRPTR
jgi:hypothetical protein